MSIAQRVIQNALFSSLSQAWSYLVAIFLTPYLLFKLGTEGFAIWSLTFVLLGALASLDLGLGVTLTKFAAAALTEHRADFFSELLIPRFCFRWG